MAKMPEVIRFLESHDWKVVASTEPYGDQRTTFARFQCSRCGAELVSFATGGPSRAGRSNRQGAASAGRGR